MVHRAAHKGYSRDNNFGLLRLICASLVVVGHVPEAIDGNRSRELLTLITHNPRFSLGDIAVDAFFVVSGFLILQSWERSKSIGDFLKKRVLRIYPGFIVAFLISAFVVGAVASAEPNYFAHFKYPRLLLEGLFLLKPTTPSVFAGRPYPMVNGSLWTIRYEFLCYLFTLLAGKIGMARRRYPLLAFCIVVACLAYGVSENVDWLAAHVLPNRNTLWIELVKALRLFAFYLVGMCAWTYFDRLRFTRAGSIIAAVALVLGLFIGPLTTPALLTAFPYLIFYFAIGARPFTAFNRLPDISYGVYLYAWPLMKLILWYFPTIFPPIATITTLMLSAVCGFVSWHLVEKRFLQQKQRLPSEIVTQAA